MKKQKNNEAKAIISATLNFLKNSSLESTVGEAYNELRAFQKDYLAKH